MLFMLTLGALLGIAGATLVHQWLSGVLRDDTEAPRVVIEPSLFPHLAPPARAAVGYRLRRRAMRGQRLARVA